MHQQGSFYEKLLDEISDGVYFMDKNRVIRYWNNGAERITGFKKDEIIGKSCRDNILMHVDESGRRLCPTELCPAHATITDGQLRKAQVYLHHKEGHRLPVFVTITPIRNESGYITGALEVFTDNRTMYEMDCRIKELEQLSLIDPLTRIGNRRYGEIHLENAFNQFNRYGWSFGVLFMDIDDFMKVNDTYGHQIGDKVLQMVASTLSHSMRTSDTVSRWGGEEFMVIAPHAGYEEIGILGRKILSLVERSSLDIASEPLAVTVSIGAALVRKDESLEDLINRVDRLMFESKSRGKNTLSIED